MEIFVLLKPLVSQCRAFPPVGREIWFERAGAPSLLMDQILMLSQNSNKVAVV